jgi:hypothetical protein
VLNLSQQEMDDLLRESLTHGRRFGRFFGRSAKKVRRGYEETRWTD